MSQYFVKLCFQINTETFAFNIFHFYILLEIHENPGSIYDLLGKRTERNIYEPLTNIDVECLTGKGRIVFGHISPFEDLPFSRLV